MTSMELLELLNNVSDSYVADARMPVKKVRTLRRPLLVAAIVALMLLLVGCTVAYVSGWFTDFFAARSEEPLSPEQVEFIQEHEQIIQETQVKGDWTIELKSAIRDGKTAYVIFGVTAPEDVDLEEANIHTPRDWDDIIPGNKPSMVMDMHAPEMLRTSLNSQYRDMKYYYAGGTGWQADNDGLPNTLDFYFRITIEKLDPKVEIDPADLFRSDIEFYFCFQNFIHTWEDAEKQAEIDAKYAGQDYMIDGEELEGLHKFETLVEETWEFTITFDEPKNQTNSVELITGEPVTTWAKVFWRIPDDNPMGYIIGDGIAAVKIKSFVLNPFGATLTYEYFEEAHNNAFIEYGNHTGYSVTGSGYTDRFVYAVMKDGSRISLRTDGTGDKLKADVPIVLSEVDHILLGSGEQLFMPE